MVVVAAFGLAPPAAATKFVHRVVAGEAAYGPGAGQVYFPGDSSVNLGSVADGALDPTGDPVDGYVYVADQNNHRIQVFSPDGEFKFMFGAGVDPDPVDAADALVCDRTEVPCTGEISGTAGGMFGRPEGVVVDQGTGHLFVRDRNNRRVQELAADGSFVRAWGWDVVQEGATHDTAADEFETCFVAAECKAGASGSGLGQFGSTATNGGGIDIHRPTGDLLVADPANQRVQRFEVPADPTAAVTPTAAIGPFPGLTGLDVHVAVDDAGVLYAAGEDANLDRYDLVASAFMDPVPVDAFTGPLALGPQIMGLEIDRATGNLLLMAQGRDGFGPGSRLVNPVLELATPGAADAADVTLVDSHLVDTGLGWWGLGLDSDTGDLFVTAGPQVGASRVFAANDGPAGPTSVSFLPFSDVGAFGATVNVEINSNWPLESLYEVQVARSSDPADFETVATGEAPAGTDPVVEAIEIEGLRPKTPYLVRVVTRKPYGNPQRSVDGPVLLTKAAPPSVAGVRADAVDATSVRLSGRVNPNGTASRYRFEWGLAGQGLHNVVPLPDASVGSGFDFEFVAQRLTGLEPGTTYEFRLVATSDDSALGVTASAVESFTTRSSPAGPSGRAFELVSPADKIAGVGVGEWYAGPGSAVASGLAAHVGERFAARGHIGSMLLDAPMAWANDWALVDRVDSDIGWVSHTPATHVATAHGGTRFLNMEAASPDLSLLTLDSNGGLLHLFPEMAEWMDSQVNNPSFVSDWEGRWEIFAPTDLAQVPTRDAAQAITFVAGAAPVVVGTTGSGASGGLRGVAGPGDPTHPSWPDLLSGRTVYVDDVSAGLSDSFPGAGVRELVHVCAGGTELPAVDGAGGLFAEACPPPGAGRDARLISGRGATTFAAGSPGDGVVSADGSRVFFLAPDPGAGGVPDGVSSFCTAAGQTCPAQLFVRQRNSDGSIVTRWISRAEDGLFGSQDASLLGAVRFEGATVDGDKVFFRTNSPLTVDDPNGLGAPTPGGVKAGTASSDSWDLYMYDLPDGQDADPAGGTLTRITAGPTGDADCNRPQGGALESAILRFASVDGDRVYFVCAGPLAGVAAPSDLERLTAPGGDPSTTDQANLYLYDAGLPTADRWRFVARLPAETGGGVDGCATAGAQRRSPVGAQGQSPHVQLEATDVNCVRGIDDGGFVTFWTRGRLVVGDPDDSSVDVYGYDADRDELIRLSARQGGVGGTYECVTGGPAAGLQCYGDNGFDSTALPNLGVASNPLIPGSRVAFFQSRSRLVPEDRDDGYDVYEWRDGVLSLVSTGRSSTDGAFYKGNDASGRNVYFATRDALTWQDADEVLDIYTARVGGGIAEPPPPPVCDVLGQGCQPEGGDLVVPKVGSTAPGAGNVEPGTRPHVALSLRRPGRRALRRAARTGVVRLAVRAGRRAVVRGVARARLGGRARRVGAGRARVRRSGRGVLRLRLNRRAMRVLRRRGRLAVVVRAKARGADPAAVRLVLRRPGR